MLLRLRRLIYTIKGYYKDENGYWRTKEGFLVSRLKAYKRYMKKRDEYPLPYSFYIVHHKDKDKENNSKKNLIILTKNEHEYTHKGINKETAVMEFTHMMNEIGV